MPDTPGESATKAERDRCLDISLQSVASHILSSDGREIPFSRAVLTIRNICGSEVIEVAPHAKLGQEGGTVQDVTGSFSQSSHSSIPPGGAANWDVYDLLIPAHPGTASKIHMFGYRAALNWRFELEAWAEYRLSGSSITIQTPVSRWVLRWSVADPATAEVALTVEDLPTHL
jgi:hypothetical protein